MNRGLDGVYVVRQHPEFLVKGVCPMNGFWPTATYWNRDSPIDRPIFVYWQYYKDHYSICPQFDADGADCFGKLREGGHGHDGPGLAFFQWERSTWWEFDGNNFVKRKIAFRVCLKEEVFTIPSLVIDGAFAQLPPKLPRARTPTNPIARTPTNRIPTTEG